VIKEGKILWGTWSGESEEGLGNEGDKSKGEV